MRFTGWVLAFVLVFASGKGHSALPSKLSVTPSVIYLGETIEIQVVAVGNASQSQALFLVEIDEAGNRIRDFGVLTDTGLMGDVKKRRWSLF